MEDTKKTVTKVSFKENKLAQINKIQDEGKKRRLVEKLMKGGK